MTLKLSGYLFTGPFPIDKTIIRANQPPVVFIVIAKGGPGWAPTFRVIDVGYTEDTGIVFADHVDQRKCIQAIECQAPLFALPGLVRSVSHKGRSFRKK